MECLEDNNAKNRDNDSNAAQKSGSSIDNGDNNTNDTGRQMAKDVIILADNGETKIRKKN